MKFFYTFFLASFFGLALSPRDLFYLPEHNRAALNGVKGKLVGIVLSDTKRACLLSDDVSGVTSYVEEGMTWSGYEITEIKKHSLVLRKGKIKRMLFLN